MNPIQESKQELEASIRYAENAIDKAKQTIEQVGTYQEQTGREEALTKKVQELEDKVQGQYDDIKQLEYDLTAKTAQASAWKKEVDKLRSEREASSGPCGCQAYRDLEERADSLGATIQRLKRDEPTMPVIPKDVAIAIFREGVQSGVNDAVAELEGQTISISESEYVGDFEVSFTRDIYLDDELDFDWMRGKVGQYEESFVVDALKGLCADKEFECRIHGIDDND